MKPTISPRWKWREQNLRHHGHLSLLDHNDQEILRLENWNMTDVSPTMELIAQMPEALRLLRESARLLDNLVSIHSPDGYHCIQVNDFLRKFGAPAPDVDSPSGAENATSDNYELVSALESLLPEHAMVCVACRDGKVLEDDEGEILITEESCKCNAHLHAARKLLTRYKKSRKGFQPQPTNETNGQ